MTGPSEAAVQVPTGADLARLQQLAGFLERARATLRFVGYDQAEADSALLAERLRAALPADELARASFVGVPRGGLLVLGMLSYLLDLEPRQLGQSPPQGASVVLVDDCALTGARLHRELRRLGERPVVVALLYAHPELCRAVVEREPAVAHCLAAHDLEERTAELYPDPEERRRWRREWAERLDGERYWVGVPELVGFAWSEPDRLVWNPVSERVESGWRFLGAERCLEHRAGDGLPPRAPRPRRWRVDPTVVEGRFDEAVLLYLGRSDEVFRLAGVAAQMWRALAAWGSPEDVVDHLESEYRVGRRRLAGDLERFIASLAEVGLVEPVPGAGRAGPARGAS